MKGLVNLMGLRESNLVPLLILLVFYPLLYEPQSPSSSFQHSCCYYNSEKCLLQDRKRMLNIYVTRFQPDFSIRRQFPTSLEETINTPCTTTTAQSMNK